MGENKDDVSRRRNCYTQAGFLANAAVLGLIAGYYREKSGSLIPAIGAHMTFNIVGVVVGSVVTVLAGKAL